MNINAVSNTMNFGALYPDGQIGKLAKPVRKMIAKTLQDKDVRQLAKSYDIHLRCNNSQAMVIDVLDLQRKDGMRSAKIISDITTATKEGLKKTIKFLADYNSTVKSINVR
ncbi:MAG: hypothetical protein PHX18_06435 [Candidatus Gastranaerophilales bacterium]|nr:hypothetical protein [Candidatus Gastranaerophilales bacterium]